MNPTELKTLMEYVKGRYDEVKMDYKTFSGDIDTDLTYEEQKNLIDTELNNILPMVIKKPNVEEMKHLEAEQRRLEQERQEAEIQSRLDKEIESITNDSVELEKMYFYPIECLEMVANGKAKGFLLYGQTSLGKSYRVKEVFKRLGKIPINKEQQGDYKFFSGQITPLSFYLKMHEYRDKIIVLDDVDVLNNLIILNMIKAGLNENSGNVVEYHTSRKLEIPNSFIFNGQMIILLNEIPKENEHLKAIMSRILHHELKFSREEIIKIIFEIAYKGKGEIMEGTDLKERLEIAKWLRDNTSKATTNLNIRLFLQAVSFYKWNKDKWKELILGQIQNNELIQLIIQGCDNDKWVEETGLTIRTLQRYKKKLGLGVKIGNL